jgi:hypothetical protein
MVLSRRLDIAKTANRHDLLTNPQPQNAPLQVHLFMSLEKLRRNIISKTEDSNF